MKRDRIAVTGLGLICALGDNVNECWRNAADGISGVCDISRVNTDGCYSKKGALNSLENSELSDDDYDRSSLLCVKAAGEALSDAGISEKNIGVIVGNCVGGAASIDEYFGKAKQNGEENVPKEDILKMPAAAIANNVSAHYGLNGVTANIVNACAAGTISLAYACDLIRAGEGEIYLAGGSDAFTSLAFAGFHALHALDEQACSPFNRSSGITLGEGAGMLVLESYEHAVARGAKIYCEVLGSGVSSDAYHITAPRPDGEGQISAIERAMKNSGLEPADIGYINAHGTGTAKNDEAEFLSLHTIFDGKNDKLSVSSTKSMTGHCLGAAGSIEAVFVVKAIEQGIIPPTTGYTSEDLIRLKEKAGGIDFTPNESVKKTVDFAMSNSFAFGGNNASIIFSKEPREIPKSVCDEPIYITGLGVVSGEINNSDSARALLTSDDYKAHNIKMAFYRKLDRFSQIQLVSGAKALADAKLNVGEFDGGDVGIIIGTADGPMTEIVNFQKNVIDGGTAAGSAFAFPNTVYNAAGGYFSIYAGIKGYNVTVANGWQAGLQSVCYARQVIRNGQQRIMVAAGTDENTDVTEYLYGKYGVKSKDLPYSNGDGFVLGEGSASMVMETRSSALGRGAPLYAELVGCAVSHTAAEQSDYPVRETIVSAINKALVDAGLTASDIKFVSAFGCGIKQIDEIELSVYRDIFGENIKLLSVKSVTGEARAASAANQLVQAAAFLAGEKYVGKWFELSASGAKETSAPKKGCAIAVSVGAGGNCCAAIIKAVRD